MNSRGGRANSSLIVESKTCFCSMDDPSFLTQYFFYRTEWNRSVAANPITTITHYFPVPLLSLLQLRLGEGSALRLHVPNRWLIVGL
jgi:hypothetical protein